MTKTISPILLCFFVSTASFANEEEENEFGERPSLAADESPFYRSPEERREAGLGTEVTEWLKISGLLELEHEKTRFTTFDNITFSEKERPVKTIQLGMDFTFGENFEAELVLEAEDAENFSTKIDEALITYDVNDFGFTLGRMSVPFGEYYSHFVIDPMLEFGETRADSFVIDYSLNDNLELGVFWLKSEVDVRHEKTDWGFMLEWKSLDESLRFGASYLSDISESDEQLLGDYSLLALQRVAAASASVLWGFKDYEISAEFVKTLDKFKEFEPDFDQPEAYNLELAYYPNQDLQFALRYEHSKELEDQPENRFGIGLRWLVYDHISIGVDYMQGDYKLHPLAPSDQENSEDELSEDAETAESPLADEHIFAAQISIEF